MSTALSLAPLLERFFTQRLMQQRQVSPHTISSSSVLTGTDPLLLMKVDPVDAHVFCDLLH